MFETGEYEQTDVKVHDGKVFSVVWAEDDTLLTTAAHGIVVSIKRSTCLNINTKHP